MSFITISDLAVNTLQIVVLFFVILNSFIKLEKSNHKLVIVFFALAMTSYFMSLLYWYAYEIIRPNTRMPLSVSSMGENATFLLLGASLSMRVSVKKRLRPEYIGTVIFMIGNVVLWILWTEEWIQDILGGIAFGYLALVVTGRIIETEVWKKRDLIIHSLVAVSVLAVYFVQYALGEEWTDSLDTAVFIILLFILLYSFINVLMSFTKKSNKTAEQRIILAFIVYLWAVISLYSTSGKFYFVMNMIECVTFPLMMITVLKEEAKNDIR